MRTQTNPKSIANLKPTGRPKGVKNKSTTSIKEAVTTTFDKLGGAAGLIQWCHASQKNMSAFYTLIWPRLIPKEVNLDATVTHDIASRLLEARNKALELTTPARTMEIDNKGHTFTPPKQLQSVAELMIQEAIEDDNTIDNTISNDILHDKVLV